MKKIFIPIILSLLMILSAIPIFAQSQCDSITATYVEGYGCVEPKYKATTEVIGAEDKSAAASSLDIIKITNPWAAQGQPVIVRFTLSNIGDQYSYPYNQIELPPNNYVLMMGVDKDMGMVAKDGSVVDLWSIMTNQEKFWYMLAAPSTQFLTAATNAVKGQVCGYVDIYNAKFLGFPVLNDRLKAIVDKKTDSRSLYQWSCLKITDKPYFANELKSYCSNKIDSACISNINKDFGNSVTDTINVMLSDTRDGKLLKGECARSNNQKGIFGSLERFALPMVKWNSVMCSIGDEGIKPGQSITFDFVVLVPSDAPVISPGDLSSVELGDTSVSPTQSGAFTTSASCAKDKNSKACHSIYAAVYPLKTDNFLTFLIDFGSNSAQNIGCLIKWAFTLGGSKIDVCQSSITTMGFQGTGDPIWEGSGIFYILGPLLSGSIELILWAAYIAGGITGLLAGKK